MLEQILKEIKKINKQPLIIAIDGKAASGKTTLANDLRPLINAEIISMDDFFLPKNLRTEERFNEIGGNIHYERFLEEVIVNLSKKHDFAYQIFDCETMDYHGQKVISNKQNIIIEGSYSQHPIFGDYADLTIFLDIDDYQQKERLKKRSPYLFERFVDEWIPLENRYFQHYQIKAKANIKNK